jgi:hypothetical protein
MSNFPMVIPIEFSLDNEYIPTILLLGIITEKILYYYTIIQGNSL